MFYQTEAKPQGWRAVAVFDDRGDALLYLGRSRFSTCSTTRNASTSRTSRCNAGMALPTPVAGSIRAI
jgi:hypothetical protein